MGIYSPVPPSPAILALRAVVAQWLGARDRDNGFLIATRATSYRCTVVYTENKGGKKCEKEKETYEKEERKTAEGKNNDLMKRKIRAICVLSLPLSVSSVSLMKFVRNMK